MRFSIQSKSSGEIYQVEVVEQGRTAIITCTCPAAENGQSCWHRLAIITGSGEGVVDGANNLTAAAKAFVGSKAAECIAELTALERQKADITRRISATKKLLANAMAHG